MTYDKNAMFEPVGVAALDPRVAAYKKFVKENLGQPELMQFLQSEQGKQLDPNLAGAMIVLEQLEKARDRAPQGPPPKTSVIQDVGMAGLQRAQEEQTMQAQQQGLARLPNPAMANAQFEGGIAAPPQQMAGGGIVAFANEGAVQSSAPPVWTEQDAMRLNALTALMNEGVVFGAYGEPVTGVGRSKALRAAQVSAQKEYADLIKRRNAAEEAAKKSKFEQQVAEQRARFGLEPKPAPATPAVAAKTPVPPVPPAATAVRAAPPAAAGIAAARPTPTPAEDPYLASLKAQANMTPEQIQAEREKRYAASGMGGVAEARRAEIARREEELKGAGAVDAAQRKKDLMLQLAAAAFGSVGKGRTLLEGLGSTGAAFAEGAAGVQKEYRGREKERKQQSEALIDARLTLQEAEAARRIGDFDTAEAKRQEAMTKMYAAGLSERQMKLEETKAETERRYKEAQIRIAELQASQKPTDAAGKPMSQKELFDVMQQLAGGPEMEAFSTAWLNTYGKKKRGSSEYNKAMDDKLRELFNIRMRSIGGGVPPEVAAALQNYMGSK